jgi:hypothetical protein
MALRMAVVTHAFSGAWVHREKDRNFLALLLQ